MLADGRQELIQVLRSRERVDERHAQGADAVQTGGNQVKVTRFNDPAPQLELKCRGRRQRDAKRAFRKWTGISDDVKKAGGFLHRPRL